MRSKSTLSLFMVESGRAGTACACPSCLLCYLNVARNRGVLSLIVFCWALPRLKIGCLCRTENGLASRAKRYPLCENKRIPFTRNPSVSCLLGRCPNPRRTQKLCSGTMDKSIGCAIFQIACGRAAQRCSASFSRRSFASSCSLSNSRIRSILALAVSSSFISSRAFR